jgi:hypothetical protein
MVETPHFERKGGLAAAEPSKLIRLGDEAAVGGKKRSRKGDLPPLNLWLQIIVYLGNI